MGLELLARRVGHRRLGRPNLSQGVVRRSLLVLSFGLLGACSMDPAFPSDPPPTVTLPPGAIGIRTVAPANAFAGQVVAIECELFDAAGEEVPWDEIGTATIDFSNPETFVQNEDGAYVGNKVGTTTVTCAVGDLVDEEPNMVTVRAGAPMRVVAHVSRDTVAADPDDPGTEVTCEILDAGGNEVSAEDVTIELGNPFAGTLTDATAHFTLASTQEISCVVPGAESTPASVLVNPGRPAQIVLTTTPSQSVYALGSMVEVEAAVLDSYGNVADSSGLSITSNPAASSNPSGTLQFTYDDAGTYTITGRIETGTVTGAPLVATATILVNDGAPGIFCPTEMRRITGAAGATWSMLAVNGRATDKNGIQSVTVNGSAVTVDANGNFATNVDPAFGANCYLVVVTDTQGDAAERCCPYIASELYSTEIAAPTVQNPGPATISMAIPQRGLDDRATSPGITPATSLADILDRGITATSLSNYLHTYFTRSGNPGGTNYVGSGNADLGIISVPVDVFYRADLFRASAVAPNTDLDLIPAGLRTRLAFTQFALGLEFRISNAPGWVNNLLGNLSAGKVWIDTISTSADWDISAANGKFRTTMIPNSFVLSYPGNVRSENGIVNALAAILPGVVKGAIEDVLEMVVGPIVQDLLGAITIDTFGIQVALPKLDGSGDMNVRVSGSFPSADANASALTASVAPYFVVTGGTPHGRTSLGVASQSPTIVPYNLVGSPALNNSSIAMALHDGAVNDLVHRLWRQGYFDGTLDPAALEELGVDFGELRDLIGAIDLSLNTPLPPVGELLPNGQLRVGLAGSRIALTIPGSSDPTPLELEMTATFDVSATITNGRIAVQSFARHSLDLRVVAAPSGVDDLVVNAMLEVADVLIDKVVGDVLARSLVGIPVPRLVFPAVLGPISLPGPMTLTITNPVLTYPGTYPNNHLVVNGGLQETP